MTMIGRIDQEAPAETAFTSLEIELLNKLMGEEFREKDRAPNIREYLEKVARLGGYLARASDPPPGNMVMWRGMSRITDIQLGYLLAKGNVGN